MEKRLIIASLGFDPSVFLRIIGRYGITDSDKVIIVSSSVEHPKSEAAISEVMNFFNKVGFNVDVKVMKLDENNFPESLVDFYCKLRTIVEMNDFSRILVDISGGPRGIGLILYITAGLLGLKEVFLTTETKSVSIEVPVMVGSIDSFLPTNKQYKLLSLLPHRPSYISKEMGVSLSSVSKLIRSLENRGLIQREGRSFKLTEKGKLVIALKKCVG